MQLKTTSYLFTCRIFNARPRGKEAIALRDNEGRFMSIARDENSTFSTRRRLVAAANYTNLNMSISRKPPGASKTNPGIRELSFLRSEMLLAGATYHLHDTLPASDRTKDSRRLTMLVICFQKLSLSLFLSLCRNFIFPSVNKTTIMTIIPQNYLGLLAVHINLSKLVTGSR